MSRYLSLLSLLLASLQALAIDTQVPELHWTLPTTLEGIRQERANLKIEEEPSNPRYVKTIWGFGYKWSDGESGDE